MTRDDSHNDAHNDDRHKDQVPEPDAPATTAEKARADGFGRLMDKLLAGDALPPAMDSDDRALVEVATMVMAGSREVELAAERRRALIDQALERAVLGKSPARVAEPPAAGPKKPGVRQDSSSEVVSLDSRREGKLVHVLPWAVASIAAAAAILLFVTRPSAPPVASDQAPPPAAMELETFHRSRPADPLIGQIAPEASAEASARLDTIYSDRMAGYRDLMFRRRLGGGGKL
jgi:hypothetical protein